ncbi:ABC transporter family substrate-binding protein [Streptomyces sp. NPDC003717]|uniref:ABC transporter family substrate-binding protein n=1 Tax=Streptomyces sp. NPDC003717 TaxID=3154276 RepID=UPI0033A3C31C
MSHVGVGPRAVTRSVVFLTAGVLAVPALAGCSSDRHDGKPLAGPDIATAARASVADGGSLRWAVDSVPDTLNTFQSDADATTARIAQAVLPAMFRTDATGRPVRDARYLESAKVVDTEPKQVVLYKLDQQAVWSDGREIGAADFAAQWRALSGKDSAYWTARNAGYDRIEKIERGANDLEVKVTFSRPYADWKSLFTPLYPKDVMGTPDAFNDGARRKLKVTAGPFALKKVDAQEDEVVLARNPRWWGEPAKLSEIRLRAVPRSKRIAALGDGDLDLADVDADSAEQAGLAAGPPATATATASKGSAGSARPGADGKGAPGEAAALRGFEVRKSLEPAYTQLALNGAEGPLSDDRVRRAVARALDRRALAEAVLKPLGLPAVPVGSHLALSGQDAYADGSGALGRQSAKEARALLADAGWVPGGPVREQDSGEKAAGAEGEKTKDGKDGGGNDAEDTPSEGGDDGAYIVGEDDKNDGRGDDKGRAARDHGGHDHGDAKDTAQGGGAPGAYAPKGTAAPGGSAAAPLAKDGKPLTLRFVLPSGPGSAVLGTVAGKISGMLEKIGIRTDVTKVSDESYFKDHIASGSYDLALYSWPGSAYPATDARPIYAKPVPAADGSLNVAQNYTRVGTDQVDQLFDQAMTTLDGGQARDLLRKADSRIWAAAGSIPLYQRPQLLAARTNLANAGAFGFATPVYEDMGFLTKGAMGATRSASPSR